MIFNATPHVINIYSEADTAFDSATRKLIVKDGTKPIQVIEPSGKLLNAKSEQVDAEGLEGCIPTKTQRFVGVDAPYDVFENSTEQDYFIVSALYVSAAKVCGISSNLLTVGGTVYSDTENPRPVGCTFLIRN